MKNKIINAVFVTLIGLTGVLTLSSGYIYAAQGVSAQDKKQLGLFNGNNEFIGTLIGIQTDPRFDGVEYQAYNSTLDAIVRIRAEEETPQSVQPNNAYFVLQNDTVYYNAPDCIGNSYTSFADGSEQEDFLPQILFVSTNPNKQFIMQVGMPLNNVAVSSTLAPDGTCQNLPTPETRSGVHPVLEVDLSYVLTGKPSIKVL